MSNEVTPKEYWDDYWGKIKTKYPDYDISRGLFYSYDLFFKKYLSKTRERLGKKKLKIIDCGCGEGLMLKFLNDQYEDIETWGIEYSDSYYKAEKMGEDLGYEFHLIKGDLLNPCDKNLIESFDIVVSFGLIEHFKDSSEIMRNMANLLRRKGCLITIIPNFNGLFNFLWKLYDKRNYRYHIPIHKEELLCIHQQEGIDELSFYTLGTPTIPGLLNIDSFQQKLLAFIILNINGRILQKLAPRQVSLRKSYPIAPIVACVGYKT